MLRRLSTNVVDVFERGTYRRALGDPQTPTLLSVTQTAPDALTVRFEGPGAYAFDPAQVVRRALGTEVDLAVFYAATPGVPWLDRLARDARGVRPPRYPSLWETVCNAVVYQQVSIHAAGAILKRTIERYSTPVDAGGVWLYPFFAPRTLLEADPDDLRAAGQSIQKIHAMKAVAAAIESGALDEASLEALPTPDLLAALVAHQGIGPWTAAVIALRGFGRLDVFPMNDSGATAGLRKLSGDPGLDAETIVGALVPQQGMLYYHLLLGRLHATGEVAL
ncbi:MAG: hypothetical protein NVS3B7_00970 [Candidatus Elarobacter sp.]